MKIIDGVAKDCSNAVAVEKNDGYNWAMTLSALNSTLDSINLICVFFFQCAHQHPLVAGFQNYGL